MILYKKAQNGAKYLTPNQYGISPQAEPTAAFKVPVPGRTRLAPIKSKPVTQLPVQSQQMELAKEYDPFPRQKSDANAIDYANRFNRERDAGLRKLKSQRASEEQVNQYNQKTKDDRAWLERKYGAELEQAKEDYNKRR